VTEGSTAIPDDIAGAEAARAAGVRVNRSDTGIQVTVPPPRGWSILAPWQWGVLGITTFRQWLHVSEQGRLLALDSGVQLALLLFVGLTAWRRRVFAVTADVVSVGFASKWPLSWNYRWPRRAIGEIKTNSTNGNLLIRVTGSDLKEFRVGDRVVTQFVADVLQDALTMTPAKA
jgi:hypothetical protein